MRRSNFGFPTCRLRHHNTFTITLFINSRDSAPEPRGRSDGRHKPSEFNAVPSAPPISGSGRVRRSSSKKFERRFGARCEEASDRAHVRRNLYVADRLLECGKSARGTRRRPAKGSSHSGRSGRETIDPYSRAAVGEFPHLPCRGCHRNAVVSGRDALDGVCVEGFAQRFTLASGWCCVDLCLPADLCGCSPRRAAAGHLVDGKNGAACIAGLVTFCRRQCSPYRTAQRSAHGEIAVTVVLLIGAGLLLKTLSGYGRSISAVR